MAKHYDKQFKLDAIQYYHDHRELGLQGCASNLGISHQTLSRWQKELRDTGDIESRGSGNYASDEAKEIARLKRVHCVWTLKKNGCEAILVNNNPETVSTDFDTGDRLYFDPLNPESVDNIIATSKPEPGRWAA